jgi:Tol biopolymer transport system component
LIKNKRMKTKEKFPLLMTIILLLFLTTNCKKGEEKKDLMHGVSGKFASLYLSNKSTSVPIDFQYIIFTLDNSGQKEVRNITYHNVMTSYVNSRIKWSPDGSKIYFSLDGFSGAIINADGTGFQQLPTGGFDFCWSPDGSKFVFTRGDPSYIPDSIYIMNTDFSGLQYITKGRFPAWSPDGTQIYFVGNLWGDSLFTINLSDKKIRKFMTMPSDSLYHGIFWSWSPDFKKILYVLGPGIYYTMNADGSNNQQAFDMNQGSVLCWSPDGEKIAVNLIGSGVYVMDLNGSNKISIGEGWFKGSYCMDWH